jgi:hypothetical protein
MKTQPVSHPSHPEKSSAKAPCRLCGGRELTEVIDLGEIPFALRLSANSGETYHKQQLAFNVCQQCLLVQISDELGGFYQGFNYSTKHLNPSHVDDLVNSALEYKYPGTAFEIGSNDGTFLEKLASCGFSPTGIEPNEKVSQYAKYPTHVGFFTKEKAKEIGSTYDFIFSRHVIEHVLCMRDFMAGVDILLADDGILVIELPDSDRGFASSNPAFLWEEHLSYPLDAHMMSLFHTYGFTVLEKREYIFGGGTRAYVCARKPLGPIERDWGDSKAKPVSYYRDFNKRIMTYAEKLRKATASKKLVLYGAGHRSSLIVNYSGIASRIAYTIDDRKDLQGQVMPGTNSKIQGTFPSEECLFLLGVPPEHEYKIVRRITAHYGYKPECISLLRLDGIAYVDNPNL